ncbi:MAG: 3-hydroxyacyl-CoA dehydrogenase family protein [Gemmatimonadota bacterium]|nr:3-hydroxyacyl-CoA dehydrogenase family protein [Gemmatimonadota bacterium]
MSIAIIGAGTMGRGIAHVAAVAGFDVVIYDLDDRTLDLALEHVRRALDAGIKRGKIDESGRRDALDRISTTRRLTDAVAHRGLVIEAAPERLELKQTLFAHIADAAPRDAVLATNTSSLSVADIAAATDCADRVLGMHFFNPVPAMKLVEIVRAPLSSDFSVERAREFAVRLGKTSIVVGDSPGFATSRLGVVLGLEAMRMLEQGVATAEDIDTAMELGYNHPVGPLRLTDIVGLDVRLAVAERLHSALGGATYAPPAILREMVRQGLLGRKTGRGFYHWADPSGG